MVTMNLTDLIAQNAPQRSGGVAPIGVVEPFNQYQRQGIQELASGAPAMGFMSGLRDAFQTQLAGAPTSADIQGDFATGRDLLSQGTAGVTDQDISQYLNPYTENVINSSLDRINREAAEQSANIRGRTGIGSRSFGTTAQGTQQGILDRGALETKAGTVANLKYSGFRDALNQANIQKNRALTGSSMATGAGISGIGSLSNIIQNAIAGNVANQRNFAQNAGNRIAAGGMIQEQNQRMLNALRPQIEGRTNFNVNNLAQLANFLGQFPSSDVGAKRGSPDALSKLGGLGLGAAGIYEAYNKQIPVSGMPWLAGG